MNPLQIQLIIHFIFSKDNQDRLEEQTIFTHKMMESNIKELTDEKALIRAGHDQLASMTEDIKSRLGTLFICIFIQSI